MTKRISLVGKGDRPRKVNQKKFGDNFDKIFNKKDEQPLGTPMEKKD